MCARRHWNAAIFKPNEMSDDAHHVHTKIMEKRDRQIEELYKLEDRCLRMNFALAKDKLELVNLFNCAVRMVAQAERLTKEIPQKKE